MNNLKIFNTTNAEKIKLHELFEFFVKTGEVRACNSSLYVYYEEKGYWKKLRKKEEGIELRKYISSDLNKYITSGQIANVVDMLLECPEMQHDFHSAEKKNKYKINLLNGVYDFNLKKIENHSADYFFTYCNNVRYVPNMKLDDCPNFLKYLKEMLDYEKEEQKTRLLLQIFGYCLSSINEAKLAFFFIGQANTGKTQLLRLLQYVIGEEFSTAIPLHKLGQRFNIARLETSRVNICDEIKVGKWSELDIFKSIVSCSRVYGELKGQDGFDFNVYTKLISAGNTMPVIEENDGTDAVISRLCILKFSKAVEVEKKDTGLLEKLIFEADIIFSIAIDELYDLVISGFNFCKPEDSLIYIEEYRVMQNLIKDFLNEFCIFGDGEREHVSKLLEEYQNFYTQNGGVGKINQYQVSDFFSNIPGVKRIRFRKEGSASLHGFAGIGLKK
jgi:putative DNA primase/helicase